MTRTTTMTWAALALLSPIFGVTGLSGCKQATLCPSLDSCGGAIPVGDWLLDANHPSCSEDVYTTPTDPRLVQADLPAARTPVPEPATYDWCDLLVTGPGDDITVKPPNFYTGNAFIGAATIHYDANGQYALSTTRTGTYILDFPAICMRAFGAVDSGGKTVCDKLTTSLNGKVPPSIRNVTCKADPNVDAQGCFCAFDLSDTQESSGRVVLQADGTMLHLPGNDFPESVSFCAQNDNLQLTGTNGTYLFDRVGLRTMSMVKTTAINCTDRMQGVGEDGVDCGPACPILCNQINCTDGVMGPGEDGVDCGPNCTMKTCTP